MPSKYVEKTMQFSLKGFNIGIMSVVIAAMKLKDAYSLEEKL